MTLLPLITQLDSQAPTAGNDCSVASLLNAVRWASDGKVGPQHHSEVAPWVARVRRWAGVKANRGLLFRSETFKAYQAPELHRMFAKAGIPDMIAEYLDAVPWTEVIRRVRRGELVHMAVDYGVLRAGKAPTASATFSGGHSLVVVQPSRVHGVLHVEDGDPLMDGRRANIPRGWTDARLIDFRAACGAWGKKPPGLGHATVIAVRRAKR